MGRRFRQMARLEYPKCKNKATFTAELLHFIDPGKWCSTAGVRGTATHSSPGLRLAALPQPRENEYEKRKNKPTATIGIRIAKLPNEAK